MSITGTFFIHTRTIRAVTEALDAVVGAEPRYLPRWCALNAVDLHGPLAYAFCADPREVTVTEVDGLCTALTFPADGPARAMEDAFQALAPFVAEGRFTCADGRRVVWECLFDGDRDQVTVGVVPWCRPQVGATAAR